MSSLSRNVSLRFRLLAATCVALALAMVLSGIVLSSLFRDHVTQQFQAALTLQLDQLTARLELDAKGNPHIDSLTMGDPRWQQPYSGLYWQVNQRTADEAEQVGVVRSRSLWDQRLQVQLDHPTAGDVHMQQLIGPMQTPLLLLERTVQIGDAQPQTFRLLVAADMQVVHDALARFNGMLVASLLVLFALLVLAAWAQVEVGLYPLRSLQKAVVAVREATTHRLEGNFPTEVQPLVHSFNAVLERNAEVVERGRMHAGNLAHALKTPLTVLEQAAACASSQEGDALPSLVREQVAVSRRYIDWHLSRARMAANTQLPGQRTALAPLIQGLVRVLERIHFEKNISIHTAFGIDVEWVAAEEQDVQEMLGNLLDNACKWAKTQVGISTQLLDDRAGKTSQIAIQIDDDGPGINDQHKNHVLVRGARLDETVPGSGLGLAIAHDLVELYGGKLELSTSPWGGLRVTLNLPSVRSST